MLLVWESAAGQQPNSPSKDVQQHASLLKCHRSQASLLLCNLPSSVFASTKPITLAKPMNMNGLQHPHLTEDGESGDAGEDGGEEEEEELGEEDTDEGEQEEEEGDEEDEGNPFSPSFSPSLELLIVFCNI
jgi:hypothetical protein